MKIEMDLNDEWVASLIAKVLRASIKRCADFGDDPEYTEEYMKAARSVIEHFGGEEAA